MTPEKTFPVFSYLEIHSIIQKRKSVTNSMKFKFYLNSRKRQYLLHPDKTYSIGRNPDNDIFLTEMTVSRSHAKLIWDSDTFLLEDMKSTNGTRLNGKKIESARLTAGDKIRLGKEELQYTTANTETDTFEETISPEDSIIIENRFEELMNQVRDPLLKERFAEIKKLFSAKKKNLSDLAYRDTLTGLNNRRSFERQLLKEWKRCKRYRHPLSLIMVDIDHFKKVNDTYGHQKGDSVLQTVSGIINDNVRSSDIPCRYGGEEMAVILPETSMDSATATAEKLRLLVEVNVREIEEINVTISLGVSTYTVRMNRPDELIKEADICLYKAKEGGRNKVITSR